MLHGGWLKYRINEIGEWLNQRAGKRCPCLISAVFNPAGMICDHAARGIM